MDSVFSLDSWKIKDLYVTVRMRWDFCFAACWRHITDLMTDGEEKMSVSDKFIQVTKLFLNMQYQIFKGKKYILKNMD